MNEPIKPSHDASAFIRAALPGALLGIVAGVALVLVLQSARGRPENFIPKAVAVVVIIAAFGGIVGTLIAHARNPRH